MVNTMLDLQAQWARQLRLPLQGRFKPLALDSSMFESRHVSRHYDKHQRQSRKQRGKKRRRGKNSGKKAGDRRRSQVVKRLPKLSPAI